MHSRSPLALYRDNIYMVPQLVRNDVSSTKVRLFVRKGMSIEYLLPGCVSKYIRRHGLYLDGIVVQSDDQPPMSSFPPLEMSDKSSTSTESRSDSGDSSSEELVPES